jgi:hypothetical protein
LGRAVSGAESRLDRGGHVVTIKSLDYKIWRTTPEGQALVFELEGKPAASDPSSPETTHGRSVPGIGRFAEEPVIC